MRKGLTITPSITNRNEESLSLFFKEISKIPILSLKEEKEITDRIKNGDEKAKDILIKANLRFVVSIAKHYQNKGVPLVDLIQEGCKGLIKSIPLYDNTKGIKFISYAVWWIRQSITKALSDQCRTIKLPISQISKLYKVNKVNSEFEQKYGRLPSPEELYEQSNISHVDSLIISASNPISLEKPIKDDNSNSLIDITPNENATLADDNINKSDIQLGIKKLLNSLPYRESDILRMSFGIDMPSMSNEEIGMRFGIGGERVRQLSMSALKMAKNYKSKLKELI